MPYDQLEGALLTDRKGAASCLSSCGNFFEKSDIPRRTLLRELVRPALLGTNLIFESGGAD